MSTLKYVLLTVAPLFLVVLIFGGLSVLARRAAASGRPWSSRRLFAHLAIGTVLLLILMQLMARAFVD